MVDGATRRRLIRTTPLFEELQIADHLILPFGPSINPSTQKKNKVLYKSSRGFEPTTFLIHDLRNDALDRSATVGRQVLDCLLAIN